MNTFNKIPDLISSSFSTDSSSAVFSGENNDTRITPGENGRTKYHTSGTIYPFVQGRSLLRTFWREFSNTAREDEGKRILMLLCVNILGTILLLLWSHTSDSMALTAYTYLTIYDIFSLLTCMLTIWVQQQHPSPQFSFGYERFEVLAVFASTVLSQLGCFFILKESVERLFEQPEIHTGRLLVGTIFAFVLHMALTYGMRNRSMNHVIAASGSSWLQEHMTDISESVCHVIPGLSKLLLPRINPFALIAFAGAVAQIIAYVLIDTKNYHVADTWAAMTIAFMILGTMFPMSVFTGKILLQTTPSHIIGQLDKLLREASTLDGVLEFRHEHFWTLSFGKLAGTVQVRVRRDADEQLVLAHVYSRLSNLVSVLTIQIFKDDWSRGSSYQMFGQSTFSSPQNSQASSPRATSPVFDGDFTVAGLSPFKPFTSPAPSPYYQTGFGASPGFQGAVSTSTLGAQGFQSSTLSSGSQSAANRQTSRTAGFVPVPLYPSLPTPKLDAFEAWKIDNSHNTQGHSHSSEGHSHSSEGHSSQGHSHSSEGHSHSAHSHSHDSGHGHSH